MSASSTTTTVAADEIYGFAAALRAAKASLDESRRLLHAYDASKVPSAQAPLFFDSKKLSVLAYKSAIERVRERFWTTTFLASGFWSGIDADILGANMRMLAGGKQTGAQVRRLFLLTIPPGEEIHRFQDERIVLRKCQDLEGLSRFDRRIASLSENVLRLLQHGCDVRVVHDLDSLHQDLPAELCIDPYDTELAIYDDWRFDLFEGGRSGVIESVRGYTPVMTQFEAYRGVVVGYFEKLWEQARPMADFIDRLQKAVDYSSTRIDYDTSWLARYDHALPREDEALKIEELSSVRLDLMRLERWGRIQRFLDVGTCTGRYPVSLCDAVRPDGIIMGVDNDVDCVRFTQDKVRRTRENDHRFQIERHDFCAPEQPSVQSFDLITCMLGTICHFEWRADRDPYEDDLQRALEKFAHLLVKDGLFFFSVWTEEACRDLRFLSIYAEEDKRQLAQAPIPRDELKRRLESVGFRVSSPIPLQDRMELYRCERV